MRRDASARGRRKAQTALRRRGSDFPKLPPHGGRRSFPRHRRGRAVFRNQNNHSSAGRPRFAAWTLSRLSGAGRRSPRMCRRSGDWYSYGPMKCATKPRTRYRKGNYMRGGRCQRRVEADPRSNRSAPAREEELMATKAAQLVQLIRSTKREKRLGTVILFVTSRLTPLSHVLLSQRTKSAGRHDVRADRKGFAHDAADHRPLAVGRGADAAS